MKVYAIRYASAERPARELFLRASSSGDPQTLAYYVWIIVTEDGVIAVDTGFTEKRAAERSRTYEHNPREALKVLGINPNDVRTLIMTHLHYDHAGDLDLYPNAQMVLQGAEMAHATGPDMASAAMRIPFALPDVLNTVEYAYRDRIRWAAGHTDITADVSTLLVGGHSRGLQAVTVNLGDGTLVLASDAAHLYENVKSQDPFPIIVDVEENLASHTRLLELASDPRRFVPGHDPLVCKLYEMVEGCDWIVDLTQPLNADHPLD